MKITLENCGRRFNQDWIFRNFNYTFSNSGKYAVLGPNGSGKSTLLSVLLGSTAPSEGTVVHALESVLPINEVYKHIGFTAPYMELVEDFTLNEAIDFHFKFANYHPSISKEGILDLLGLIKSKSKLIKYFSSGMKQRTKLALAFCSHTPLLLLDEPTANLDVQGIDWYRQLVEQFLENRLFIVASNQNHEYDFCSDRILITDYKPLINT